ncbi:MAG TPA: hypothetical protein VGA13_04010 [Acidimicrobiales bacterium]
MTTRKLSKLAAQSVGILSDPPQLRGLDYQWTRKINGKTKTRLLTAEQMDRYRS